MRAFTYELVRSLTHTNPLSLFGQIESTRIKGPEIEVKNIFEVCRTVERENFAADLPNRRRLFHGSPASNLLGLLSRGPSPARIIFFMFASLCFIF
jgi:hypothetical protein